MASCRLMFETSCLLNAFRFTLVLLWIGAIVAGRCFVLSLSRIKIGFQGFIVRLEAGRPELLTKKDAVLKRIFFTHCAAL